MSSSSKDMLETKHNDLKQETPSSPQQLCSPKSEKIGTPSPPAGKKEEDTDQEYKYRPNDDDDDNKHNDNDDDKDFSQFLSKNGFAKKKEDPPEKEEEEEEDEGEDDNLHSALDPDIRPVFRQWLRAVRGMVDRTLSNDPVWEDTTNETETETETEYESISEFVSESESTTTDSQ